MVSHVRSSGGDLELHQDDRLRSKCGLFHLLMQGNGDLALYKKYAGQPGEPKWRTETDGKGEGPYKAVLEENGNFKIVDGGDNCIWQTDTGGQGEGPYKFKVQEDGNVVIYDKDRTPTWASGTNGC